MVKKIDAVTEEEFLAQGGSQIVIDLSHLLRDRIDAAISSVMQIAGPGVGPVVLHTTALATVLTRYYTYLCGREGRIIPKEDFLDVITKGMTPHVDMLARALHDKDSGHFEAILKKLRKLEHGE